MTRLVVRAKASSKRPGLEVCGDVVEVRVAEPARDGLANEAIRRALARALGVPRDAIVLRAGQSAPRKSFEIAGLDRETVTARLLGRDA